MKNKERYMTISLTEMREAFDYPLGCIDCALRLIDILEKKLESSEASEDIYGIRQALWAGSDRLKSLVRLHDWQQEQDQ